MNRSHLDLPSILAAADRELLPQAIPVNRRPCDLRALEQRGRRQRSIRHATVIGSLLLVALAWSWGHRASTIGLPRSAIMNAVTFDRAMADLQHEATAAARAARAWQRERAQAALRAEYHALRQQALVQQIDSPLERAARINLTLAQALERQLGGADAVLAEYRRIVTKFPQTQTARMAAQRLAQLRSPT